MKQVNFLLKNISDQYSILMILIAHFPCSLIYQANWMKKKNGLYSWMILWICNIFKLIREESQKLPSTVKWEADILFLRCFNINDIYILSKYSVSFVGAITTPKTLIAKIEFILLCVWFWMTSLSLRKLPK